MAHQLELERFAKTNIEELNQEKLRFFTNLSHEFRTPVTLISGPLDKLSKSNLSEHDSNIIRLAKRNAERLKMLVNQLIDFRKIEAGKLKVQASKSDMVVFVKNIKDFFWFLANEKKIQYSFSSSLPSVCVWFDQSMMEKVIYNLMSNAFKHTPVNGSIDISLDIKKYSSLKDSSKQNSEFPADTKTQFISLEVNNTGKGFEHSEIEKIFERFYQVSNEKGINTTGAGIGLSLVKSYVQYHSGIIEVESSPENGSTFRILIPIGKKHLLPEQIIDKYDKSENDLKNIQLTKNEKTAALRSLKKLKDNIQYKIAIIEDDIEMQYFLSDLLSENYKIVTAYNGKTGYELIQKEDPDLVITDVMMPEIDGVELCKLLKENIYFCHIPVIMLTAKSSVENQIEGLSVGADSYIAKPFDIELLIVQITRLIKNREMLRERFKEQNLPDSEKLDFHPLDKAFLEQVTDFIQSNLGNTEFSITELSGQVAMSRSNLYRKIKVLTGKTPTDLVRKIRFEKSIEYLKEGKLNTTAIAYELGFSSPSYFIKCFKKEYRCSPGEYMK